MTEDEMAGWHHRLDGESAMGAHVFPILNHPPPPSSSHPSGPSQCNKGLSSQGYGFFQWSCMDVRIGL